MLDRSHRFHGYNALTFTHRQGKVIRGSQLSLKYSLNERRRTYRAAVVVSKKVSKSAVQRNRIRRRVFEVVRQHTDQISRPYDLIFVVYNAEVSTMPADELRRLIMAQLQKAGIITSVNA